MPAIMKIPEMPAKIPSRPTSRLSTPAISTPQPPAMDDTAFINPTPVERYCGGTISHCVGLSLAWPIPRRNEKIEMPTAEGATELEQKDLSVTLTYGTDGPGGKGKIYVDTQ